MPGIYKISSILKPDRFYIGSAINPGRRWKRHIKDLHQNRHCNAFLQAHFNVHGPDDLKFEIIAHCVESILIDLEQFYIDELAPTMNLCQIAGSRQYLQHSDFTKQKISDSWKFRSPISMESRLKKPRKT